MKKIKNMLYSFWLLETCTKSFNPCNIFENKRVVIIGAADDSAFEKELSG